MFQILIDFHLAGILALFLFVVSVVIITSMFVEGNNILTVITSIILFSFVITMACAANEINPFLDLYVNHFGKIFITVFISMSLIMIVGSYLHKKLLLAVPLIAFVLFASFVLYKGTDSNASTIDEEFVEMEENSNG